MKHEVVSIKQSWNSVIGIIKESQVLPLSIVTYIAQRLWVGQCVL